MLFLLDRKNARKMSTDLFGMNESAAEKRHRLKRTQSVPRIQANAIQEGAAGVSPCPRVQQARPVDNRSGSSSGSSDCTPRQRKASVGLLTAPAPSDAVKLKRNATYGNGSHARPNKPAFLEKSMERQSGQTQQKLEKTETG